MSFALQTFRAQVDYLITADDDILSEDARDEMIKAAVERYSRDAPDTQTDDVTGDGGRFYSVATELASWSEGFSRVTEIEYPAATIASDETPIYLEPEDWRDDYWADAAGTQTRYLYLPNHSPAATETMRITYTIPYTFDSTMPLDVDIPPGDFYAVCNLAACLCLQAIAARYARTSDSTIAADSVGHNARSDQFSRRAKEYCAFYMKHMGLDADPSVKAAGDFVDWDTAPGWPAGRDYIFHDKELR